MKDDQMGGVCGTHGEKYIRALMGKLNERDHLVNQGAHGMILKWI
jgi:hypothetical protein